MWLLLQSVVGVIWMIHLGVTMCSKAAKDGTNKSGENMRQRSNDKMSAEFAKTPDKEKKEKESHASSTGSKEKTDYSKEKISQPSNESPTKKSSKSAEVADEKDNKRTDEIPYNEVTALDRTNEADEVPKSTQPDKTAPEFKTCDDDRKKKPQKRKSGLARRALSQSKCSTESRVGTEKKEQRTCASDKKKKTASVCSDMPSNGGGESSDSDTFKYVKSIRDLKPTC